MTRWTMVVTALLAGLSLPGLAKGGAIGVATVNGQGVFVERTASGETIFSPRGNNFDRLDSNGQRILFDPSDYAKAAQDGTLEAAFRAMQASGYNYVRVILDSAYENGGFVGDQVGGNDVPERFWTCVGDFLNRAAAHRIHVVLSVESVPRNFYDAMSDRPDVSGRNNFTVNPEFAAMMSRFLATTLRHIRDDPKHRFADAIPAIFSIDTQNEYAVLENEAPFNRTSGTFSMAGKPYDLSDRVQRQALIDAGAAHYIDTIRRVLRQDFPSILVGASVVTPRAEHQTQYDGAWPSEGCAQIAQLCAHPVRLLALGQASDADYLDLHTYPFPAGYDFDTDVSSAGLQQVRTLPKPILMGEFGAFRAAAVGDAVGFPSAKAAAARLRGQMAASCAFGFTGWGLWTWDSQASWNPDPAVPPPQLWEAVDRHGDSTIDDALAPVAAPVICQPPQGVFKVPSGAIGDAAGSRYCVFQTYADYVRATADRNPDTVPLYPRFPALLPYSGTC